MQYGNCQHYNMVTRNVPQPAGLLFSIFPCQYFLVSICYAPCKSRFFLPAERARVRPNISATIFRRDSTPFRKPLTAIPPPLWLPSPRPLNFLTLPLGDPVRMTDKNQDSRIEDRRRTAKEFFKK